MKINWNNPSFGTRELALVKEVLETGYVSEGPKTKELEEKLARFIRVKHVIMTTSATAALYLAIEADKRIRGYDEGKVLIPNLTFIATKNAVEMANLTPRIEDVDNSRFLVEGTISLADLPKIIIPVNLLGRGCNPEFTENQPFTVICDNAGCLGSNVPNGKVGCYSLQANKLITCGQGGFCATDDDEYARVIRKIKDFGREYKYDQNAKGFNFKFNDIQAAVVLGQFDQIGTRQQLHVNQYVKYWKELDKYGAFVRYEDVELPLWIEFITDKRDELFDYLREKGIECRKPWKPLIDNPQLYPNTDYYCKNVLWLPNGSSLAKEQQTFIIDNIKKFYEE